MEKKSIKFLDLKHINNKYLEEFKETFSNFLESGWYILGDGVDSFEKEFATYCNVKFSLGVNSGFDALTLPLLAYKELGVLKDGDEVLIPANTFIATPFAVSHVGLIPIFVSPDLESMNITVEGIKKSITKKTKAIMPVHLYGRICEMDKICDFAKANRLIVIEDSAQGHGATLDNKRAGGWGDAAGFSFYPGKNLGALGDSGAITTNSLELYEMMKKIRNYGSSKKYHHDIMGINSRMDEIQAKFLSIKLRDYNLEIERRREIANRYFLKIKNIKVKLLKKHSEKDHVYHLFVVRVKDRKSFQDFLSVNTIETLVHYPVLTYQHEPYRTQKLIDLELEKSVTEIVSIPIGSHLSDNDIDYIIDVINRY